MQNAVHKIVDEYNKSQKNINSFLGTTIKETYFSKMEIVNINYKGYFELKTIGSTGLYSPPSMYDVLSVIFKEGYNHIVLDIGELKSQRGVLMGDLINIGKLCNIRQGNLIVKGITKSHRIWQLFEESGLLESVHFSSDVESDIVLEKGFINVKSDNTIEYE